MTSRAGRPLVLAVVITVWTGIAGAQTAMPPTGATRPGHTLDTLHDAVTRPLPSLPPAPRPGPGAIWVPDRHVSVPGVSGLVHVPGHWEQPTAPNEVRVPPLVGVTPDGTTVYFPGGVQPHPDQRQTP
jgi:hypothetical protein